MKSYENILKRWIFLNFSLKNIDRQTDTHAHIQRAREREGYVNYNKVDCAFNKKKKNKDIILAQ